MNIRKIAYTGTAALALMTGSGIAGATMARASAPAVVSATSRTVTLVPGNPREVHTHQVTTTYLHWSNGRYVAYVQPKVTVTDSYSVHK